jgi:hypothetical protein
MRNAAQADHSAKILSFPETNRLQTRPGVEENIDVRLRNLGNAINELLDAPYPSLLRERRFIREALEELTVKEATLRWIVRVARSTTGAVQQRLWSDIDSALTDLEKIADSIIEPESAASSAPFDSRRVSCQKKW